MKKVLATILALVMALGLCSVSWAEGTTQSTLQSRINAAGNTETTVALTGNVTESITVGSGQSIILDLKGYTLTNAAGSHTITNNGTLTIKDSSERKTGTVDNVTHARAAIYNNGTMTLEGGSYTRSAEKSNEPNRNSWYVIYNKGELTTYDGVVVKFSLTDFDTFTPAVGLNRIEDMNDELMLSKKRVKRKPIMPGSLHSYFKRIFVWFQFN